MTLLCLAALCLFSTASAQSTAFSVLYSFPLSAGSGNASGSYPVGLAFANNVFYGTTEFGGTAGSGAVFAFNVGGTSLTSLYDFTALAPSPYPYVNSDGAEPNGLMVAGGTLYGTAQEGGPAGTGTLFSLSSGGSNFAVLHAFTATAYSPVYQSQTNSDGAYPTPGLILSGNTFYGTTEQGGASGSGTVFAVNSDGTGFTVLYNFSALSDGTNGDGAYPTGGLALSGGILFGTAKSGGNSGNGTVFAVNTNGVGFTNLHSFSGGSPNASGGGFVNSDGMAPEAGLALSNTTLYGTTTAGGSGGSGTIFSLNTDGTGFATLHSFGAISYYTNSDGSAPVTELTLSGGTLYGAASDGGGDESGTVFALNTNGTSFTVLHTFTGGDDGANPYAQLIVSGNTLYGAAAEGGSAAAGTLFSLYAGPLDPPAISAQPASQFVNVGASVTLEVTATGISALSYQWYHNGSEISGATANSLALNKVTAANGGSYDVIISDVGGMVTSSVATVTVLVPPSITAQPANQTEPLAGNATFTVKATGAPLTYQWFFTEAGQTAPVPLSDGGGITGSATNKLTISPITSNDVGSYFVVVSNSATAISSKVVELNLSVERTRPSVAMTSPKANTRTSSPVLTGTASDAVRVFSVGYWVTNKNNGVVTVAGGQAALTNGSGSVSNWTIQAPLLPGTNILVVQSTNYAGLSSTLASATFFYEVPALFTLLTNGPGTITGVASYAKDVAPPNNFLLNIGEGYTLTAHPAENFLLSNWVSGSFTSNTPTFHFIMESNLSVTAHFGTNLFIGAAGPYNGLFYGSNITVQTAGMLKGLVISSSGAYSGTLMLGGSSYAISRGAFDTSLSASATVNRTAVQGGPVAIEMTLNPADGEITGSVSNLSAGGWVSPLDAEKSSTTLSAAYTVLLSPETNAVGEIPPGDGYMLITNHDGNVTLTGALADGTSFSQSVPVGAAGDVPVFHALYNNAGLLMGWVNLSNGLVAAETPMAWLKPAVRTGLYPGGFTNSLLVTGSVWSDMTSMALSDSGTLAISNSSLSLNFPVTLSESAVTKASDAPTNSLTGTIAPKTGLLTITFGNGNGRATTIGYGALLQNSTNGGGYFLTTTNAGAISLSP